MSEFKRGDEIVALRDFYESDGSFGNRYITKDKVYRFKNYNYNETGVYVMADDDGDNYIQYPVSMFTSYSPQDAPVQDSNDSVQTARDLLDTLIEQAEAKVEALRTARKALD